MARGQRHASAHPLHGPLKGWEATDITGFSNHRITHRSVPGGAIEIGHIGPHNYDQAVQRLAMGQAGPDYNNLSFHHGEHELYPKDRDFQTIFAHHPEHGEVGRLTYREMDHPSWTGMPEHAVHVTMMHVPEEHRRRGVANQLMDHLEHDVHPNTPIDHGDRRPDGNEWAKSKYNDPKGGQDVGGEFRGAKSEWTMNGKPWNVETKKYRRMPKASSVLSSPAEFGRHMQGQQHVYTVDHPSGHAQTLCAGHVKARQALDQEHDILGLDTGLTHHDSPERPELHVSNPHKGACEGCAKQVRFNQNELQQMVKREAPGLSDIAPGAHSPYSNKPSSPYMPKRTNETRPFQPHLPQSLNARFTPTQRVFTHTCGLDHRLFDGEKLRPEVRRYILSTLGRFWTPLYGPGWDDWSKVYFAGSEASEWTSDMLEGNNDFDVLVGVDYDKFKKAHPEYAYWTNEQITQQFNDQFRHLNNPDAHITVGGVPYGPFDNTWYVNQDSYDIKDIKPYAAYNVSDSEWAVKPPHLPHWSLSDLPTPVQRVLRACDALANDVLKLPEPERTQQGAALFDAWHSDRSRAFGPNGEGWYDIANLREKWLDQEGVWAEIVNLKHRFNEGLGAAREGWSNTPFGYKAAAFHHELYGSNDINKLFHGDGPTTASPWPQAGRSKHNKDYDEDLVARSITHPHEFPVQEVDPRDLRSLQPSLTRDGVRHYMESQSGKTFGEEHGNDNRVGNDVSRIYHREDGQKLILSGHHRAAAALLKGEPHRAIVIHGPWGKPRV